MKLRYKNSAFSLFPLFCYFKSVELGKMVVPEKLLMKKIKKREKIKKQLVAAKQNQKVETEPSEERKWLVVEVRFGISMS